MAELSQNIGYHWNYKRSPRACATRRTRNPSDHTPGPAPGDCLLKIREHPHKTREEATLQPSCHFIGCSGTSVKLFF